MGAYLMGALAGAVADPGQYNKDIAAGAVVARTRRTSDSSTSSGSIVEVARLDGVALLAGYLYEIKADPLSVTSAAGDVFTITLRAATGGSTATGASTAIQTVEDVVPSTSAFTGAGIAVLRPVSADEELSVVLCIIRSSGSGSTKFSASATKPLDLMVICRGVDPGDTGLSL